MANMTVFAIVRLFAPFTGAVLSGAVAGVVTSMILTSVFVFKTGSVFPKGERLARFLAVHGLVVLIIWGCSEYIHHLINQQSPLWADWKILWIKTGDALAFIVGVGIATPIGFLLHRNFTYAPR